MSEYECKWHPVASRSGLHDWDECLNFLAMDLVGCTNPDFEVVAGPQIKKKKIAEAVAAIKELTDAKVD